MKSSARWVILLASAAFIVLVLYLSVSGGQHRCEVCMTFNGRTNCATAVGATEQEARDVAQTTACGPIAAGMAQSINCNNTRPSSTQCTGD